MRSRCRYARTYLLGSSSSRPQVADRILIGLGCTTGIFLDLFWDEVRSVLDKWASIRRYALRNLKRTLQPPPLPLRVVRPGQRGK